MDHITTHATTADTELPSPTHGAGDIIRLLIEAVVGGEVQDLEDLIYDIFSKRLLATAEGDTLDLYGKLFGVPRRKLTDSEYLSVIYGALLALTSEHGVEETLLKIVKGITEAEDIDIFDTSPGGYLIQWELSTVSSDDKRERIVELLDIATSYGVQYTAVESESSAFKLDSSTQGLDAGKLGSALKG